MSGCHDDGQPPNPTRPDPTEIRVERRALVDWTGYRGIYRRSRPCAAILPQDMYVQYPAAPSWRRYPRGPPSDAASASASASALRITSLLQPGPA
eukprot:scaffold5770_cov388-Prasinococcus_capsulatus_cf.AAC.8